MANQYETIYLDDLDYQDSFLTKLSKLSVGQKFGIFLITLIVNTIIMTMGYGLYYYAGFNGLVIIGILGLTYSARDIDLRDAKEVEAIIQKEVEFKMKNNPGELEKGELKVGPGCHLHETPEGAPLKWEMGFSIREPESEFPNWFSMFVGAKKTEIGNKGINKLNSEYKGSRLQRIYVRVPMSEKESKDYYKRASQTLSG